MANYSEALDNVFAALSDPTRRAVVRRLGAGEASVSELAADTSMALPSFLKHVRTLERSGIVRTSKVGRVRMCSLRREQLAAIDDWLIAQRRGWEERTDRLEDLVTRPEQEET
ncbi:metalloregulator ArsR/SmtB family transcription factor [Leifsonia bigeumensis]|uniref:Metalloregulator ArsR/SmtB family transcription factor n=1 Tax=Leifsonella bigeumensis TaxID=433643 RepID=A0ABP7FIT0_9MICO